MRFFEDYSVSAVLDLCENLQRQHTYGHGDVLCEMEDLMRMVVERQPNETTAYAVCRLLFRSKSDVPLRSPFMGLLGYLGDTQESDWSLSPLHAFEGVPFAIVSGYRSLAGLPEYPSSYLAYCLMNGVWNSETMAKPSPEQFLQTANKFIAHGPWKRPLTNEEKEWILAQY
jgi:hypothetical protein